MMIRTIQAKSRFIGFLLMFNLICFASSYLQAALPPPPQQRSAPPAVDITGILREMKDGLDSTRHEIRNHETEIQVIEEKLANYDTIIDSVRDQAGDSTKKQREQLKNITASIEGKLASLETSTKGFVGDLQQFKSHANQSTTTLILYKQKIDELEKTIEQQGQNIEHLQSAMRSLMDALQTKEIPPSKSITSNLPSNSNIPPSPSQNNDYSYRIKAGDSLEKIARTYGVTVKAIKELNNITSDKIVVGKVIEIPEK